MPLTYGTIMIQLNTRELACTQITGSDSWTERRGRVFNSPVSFSGGPGLKSRPGRPDVLIEVFRGFYQSLQANPGIVH
jgi:hypothetical protein